MAGVPWSQCAPQAGGTGARQHSKRLRLRPQDAHLHRAVARAHQDVLRLHAIAHVALAHCLQLHHVTCITRRTATKFSHTLHWCVTRWMCQTCVADEALREVAGRCGVACGGLCEVATCALVRVSRSRTPHAAEATAIRPRWRQAANRRSGTARQLTLAQIRSQ